MDVQSVPCMRQMVHSRADAAADAAAAAAAAAAAVAADGGRGISRRGGGAGTGCATRGGGRDTDTTSKPASDWLRREGGWIG